MIYGLYLSATGVLTNTHRQDVIANNLANSETVGFKRDLALFHERLTEAQEQRRGGRFTNDLLEGLGGGLFASPTATDLEQGDLESTGSPLDAAIQGSGFFAVSNGGAETHVTRDGRFSIDNQGYLVMANAAHQRVLGADRQPIVLDPRLPVTIGKDGQITQNEQPAGRIGLFDVADPDQLTKRGGTLMALNDAALTPATDAQIHSEFLERANVDPASELATLMDAQRQLEANANMIRYQDQTLAKLVNEVGKIG